MYFMDCLTILSYKFIQLKAIYYIILQRNWVLAIPSILQQAAVYLKGSLHIFFRCPCPVNEYWAASSLVIINLAMEVNVFERFDSWDLVSKATCKNRHHKLEGYHEIWVCNGTFWLDTSRYQKAHSTII